MEDSESESESETTESESRRESPEQPEERPKVFGAQKLSIRGHGGAIVFINLLYLFICVLMCSYSIVLLCCMLFVLRFKV